MSLFFFFFSLFFLFLPFLYRCSLSIVEFTCVPAWYLVVEPPAGNSQEFSSPPFMCLSSFFSFFLWFPLLFLLYLSRRYFETQEHYDVVSIHAGIGRTDGPVRLPLVAALHGNVVRTIRVPGSEATVVFFSDGAIARRGFRASIQYLPSRSCTSNAQCGSDAERGTCVTMMPSKEMACVCADGWHGFDCRSPVCVRESAAQTLAEEKTGVLLTNHPVEHPVYSNDLVCQWQFLPPPAASTLSKGVFVEIRVQVVSFDIERDFDTLIVSLMDGSKVLHEWSVVKSIKSEKCDSGIGSGDGGGSVETSCKVTKAVNAEGISTSIIYFNKACNAPCNLSYLPKR